MPSFFARYNSMERNKAANEKAIYPKYIVHNSLQTAEGKSMTRTDSEENNNNIPPLEDSSENNSERISNRKRKAQHIDPARNKVVLCENGPQLYCLVRRAGHKL